MLERLGEVSTLKLQKLVYYAQVWSLVEDGEPLFPDVIQAWAQGPVVPALFQQHKGLFTIQASDLEEVEGELSERERGTIERVLERYGDLPAEYLRDLTHHEEPWRKARAGEKPKPFGSPDIPLEALLSFYRGKTSEELEIDYQLTVARRIMDERTVCLARLAQ